MKTMRYIKFLLKLFVSCIFIFFLIKKINVKEIILYISEISPVYIIFYIIILIFGNIISAFKWKILANFWGFNESLKKYFKLYLTGSFLNNFFPGFIGGDTYRSYQLGKKNKKYPEAIASVIADRFTGLAGAIILFIFFGLINIKIIKEIDILFFLFIFITFLFFILLLFFKIFNNFYFFKKILEYLPEKINKLLKYIYKYKGSRELKISIMLSIFYGLVGLAILNYILFLAIGIKIDIINYLTVIFLISVVSSLPVSINNIGIKEWAYVTFFGFFGISTSAVVSIAIISRILQMFASFIALPFYIKNKKDLENIEK